MAKWEQQAALGVTGLAVFQIVDMWNKNAPTLQDLRAAVPGELLMRNQLLDTSILVGGIALVAGVALAIMTDSVVPLLLLLGTFGFVAVWYHMVLSAHNVQTSK